MYRFVLVLVGLRFLCFVGVGGFVVRYRDIKEGLKGFDLVLAAGDFLRRVYRVGNLAAFSSDDELVVSAEVLEKPSLYGEELIELSKLAGRFGYTLEGGCVDYVDRRGRVSFSFRKLKK